MLKKWGKALKYELLTCEVDVIDIIAEDMGRWN